MFRFQFHKQFIKNLCDYILALTRQFIQLCGLKCHPQALNLYFLSWSLLGALDSYATAYLRVLLGSEAGVPATLAKEPVLPTVSPTSTQAITTLLKPWLIHLPPSPHPIHQHNLLTLSQNMSRIHPVLSITTTVMINIMKRDFLFQEINTHFLILNATSEFDHSFNNKKMYWCIVP